MPLDWETVEQRYANGATIPTIAGHKTLAVSGADDTGVHIRSPLWEATLSREHLEQGVRLLESGEISRNPALFVEDYKSQVTDYRPTSAAHVLRDLGFLDQEGDFTVNPRSQPGHEPIRRN